MQLVSLVSCIVRYAAGATKQITLVDSSRRHTASKPLKDAVAFEVVRHGASLGSPRTYLMYFAVLSPLWPTRHDTPISPPEISLNQRAKWLRTLMTTPFGSATKNRRTPQGSSAVVSQPDRGFALPSRAERPDDPAQARDHTEPGDSARSDRSCQSTEPRARQCRR